MRAFELVALSFLCGSSSDFVLEALSSRLISSSTYLGGCPNWRMTTSDFSICLASFSNSVALRPPRSQHAATATTRTGEEMREEEGEEDGPERTATQFSAERAALVFMTVVSIISNVFSFCDLMVRWPSS